LNSTRYAIVCLLTLTIFSEISMSSHAAPPEPVAASAAASDKVPLDSAVHDKRLGLFPAGDFRLTDGHCADCAAIPQALWYFRDTVIAVPKPGITVSGFSTALADSSDVAVWAADGGAATLAHPGLVWLGAPDTIAAATISPDGRHVTLLDGSRLILRLEPKLASNRAYFNAASLAFFGQRPVSMRGTLRQEGPGLTFIAETIWPASWSIDGAALTPAPLAAGETLRSFVRAEKGGVDSAYADRLIWQRHPGTAVSLQDRPALAIVLSGGQGDDDESLGGHFAVATGTFGEHGQWKDWLANNFYPLDAVSEKGILASAMPMDKYLFDLNGGQQYYRPSYMLVFVLNKPAVAAAYQGGAQRMLNHYYRHDIEYDNATENCTGFSIDVLTSLGWAIPRRGPTHALKAIAAYPYAAITNLSLKSGRQAYDYLHEEQIRLYPAVAFEAAGEDLLRVVDGKAARPLTAFERQLQGDVDAVILVRMPQVPSSRAAGSAPVFSYDEYMARVPKNRADWKVIPVPPRPFPAALRDGLALESDKARLLPSEVGIGAGIGLALLALCAGAVHLLRRRRHTGRRKP
jgi:hypothetical protein